VDRRRHASGIIGEAVDLTVAHLEDVRPSTVLFNLTKHLIYKEWPRRGEDPKLQLFGQFKRITKQWLDTCLVCRAAPYPAMLLYEDLADEAAIESRLQSRTHFEVSARSRRRSTRTIRRARPRTCGFRPRSPIDGTRAGAAKIR